MTTTTTTTTTTKIYHYYRPTIVPHSLLSSIQEELHRNQENKTTTTNDINLIESIETEHCFNVEIQIDDNDDDDDESPKVWKERLEWLLAETFEPQKLSLESSTFNSSNNNNNNNKSNKNYWDVEFGPRMTFTSAFSSNATSICHACGLSSIQRLERSRRFRFHLSSSSLSSSAKSIIESMLHDRMTEQIYTHPITTFQTGTTTESVRTIPIMTLGRKALEQINNERGLGFDDFDLDYYTTLFKEKLGRDPTDVECFDMGQSNSEHSRHWFFGGKMVIDGKEKPLTLFQMVKSTLIHHPNDDNSIIAFHDNSSAIAGYPCTMVRPTVFGNAGPMKLDNTDPRTVLHPILTAETHNFPSGVAPFPGAETGTGGRLRDVMATGRGAYPVAGISAYCVGNLLIPGYALPWEDEKEVYPSNLASPLEIELRASDGASDYGNKYGEPVIHGFTRSFGMRVPSTNQHKQQQQQEQEQQRWEWVKPIMFSAGVGLLDSRHTTKGQPEPNMLVVKIGGPAYRIGIGGGAASSRVQSSENASLDFDAVQRGDAEMENRMNRLMRACCDLGDNNPIVSVHDQGAGGNGNVLKELVEPAGASYDIRKVLVGDHTMSVLEIWGAEYQENNALLIRPSDEHLFRRMAKRENCPCSILGHVTGDGKVVVKDSNSDATIPTPVDLPLDLVLGKMPQKTFVDYHTDTKFLPLSLPVGTTVMNALDRVLRLLSVGSKRFLVHKVDRSVTGLIAQQQCVGPLQLPLSNVAVTAHTHFSLTGTAVACGEQPIKGLIDSAAMARMTVAESMTNLVWAKISNLRHVKASGNWMYAAKLPGEGAKMYDACEALRDSLLELGCSIDGGKDSLSMAAKCGTEVVKAPGELTLTCYVTCPDITKTITPDLLCPPSDNDDESSSSSSILFVDLGGGNARLGGSSLAHVYKQIGNKSPDMDHGFAELKRAFVVTQTLIDDGMILSGHDRSDGGLIVTLLEMAFAGNCSIDVTIPLSKAVVVDVDDHDAVMATLFNEEAGFVLEVLNENIESVMNAYQKENVSCIKIGSPFSKGDFIRISTINNNNNNNNNNTISNVVVDEKMTVLRDIWEATSFQLERRQRNIACVKQEEEGLKFRSAPQWKLTYIPKQTSESIMKLPQKPKVAILRQEGSNGDREMISAFLSAGFEAWDVCVNDLLRTTNDDDGDDVVTLDQFRGIVFVGGFSYADVLDSGKGWAGVINFNENLLNQFRAFYNRSDTFSLGVCNGCQLMALLGWIPFGYGGGEGEDENGGGGLKEVDQPRLLENESEKFESRFVSVKIMDSPAIMFKGMEGSSLGVWVAHGEGRFYFPNTNIQTKVLEQNLAPLRYVNDTNDITMDYPFNPNGSPNGIAALCSKNGRHLALMPHPERAFMSWQWPWIPLDWKKNKNNDDDDGGVGPWMQMFQNARDFCDA